MKNTPDNQQQTTAQPIGQGSVAVGAAQKPRRRRVRTCDKIMNDPFILTC